MSTGVSGATLWVPVYLLWLKLDAPVAFWLGLLTMLFGLLTLARAAAVR